MPQSTRLYTAGKVASVQAQRIPINVQGSAGTPGASLPALQSFPTTAETQFTDPALAQVLPLALAIPPGGPCEQEPFDMVISGYITTTQSATCTFKLYLGTSSTIGNNTLLTSFGASGTIATTTVNFELHVRLVYDSVSGKITGRIDGIIGATVIALAICTGAVPLSMPNSVAINNNAANTPVATFTLTATFSAAATANSVNLKDWGINH